MQTLFKNRLFSGLLLLLSGLISVFAFAPINAYFLITISLVCLLGVINHDLCGLDKRKLVGLLYIYFMAYFNAQLYWVFYSLHVVIGANFVVALIIQIFATIYISTYMVLGIYCYSRFKTNFRVFDIVFLFPSFWVLSEWLKGWLLNGFPWCEIGYTQVNNALFKGVYPIFGNYGVSWLVISLSGVLYLLIANKIKPLTVKQLRFILIYAIVSLLFGVASTNILYTSSYGNKVKISMLQGDITESAKWGSNKNLMVYKNLIESATGEIILMPETAITQFERDLPRGYIDGLIKTVINKKANLVVGMPKIINMNNDYVNAAVLLTSPEHKYYAKYHLVPFGEYIPYKSILAKLYRFISVPLVGFSAGDRYQAPLVISNQKVAFNICYENGFGSELIKAAANSTMMVNLSDMVWYGDSIAEDEHLQLSQARAMENQRYFIQDTNTGLTAVIRPDGSIQSRLPDFKRGILTDYIDGRIGITPYERFGNYPILVWILSIIALSFIYRKLFTK